ncbi:MAG: Gfo/Idh/MocA family oxidoreductase [Propionibacteriaceae bacterium]|jgi:predicted dehydrogenase|nr:Gfo/Idh/MocA family oxidoreductase [Propionibacteriaceae bacterium]
MSVTDRRDGPDAAVTPDARAVPDLRLGVIGLGARAGLGQLADRPGEGSAVVAICDPDPVHLDRRRPDFPRATGYSDHRALLELGLDAVLVTSPDWTHEDIAADVLEAGVALFLEKPIAITTAGADRLLAIAARTDTPFYVGHNMRHMPVVTLLRDLIRQGAVGEVKTIWCRHFVGHGGDFYFRDWHADRRLVTGLLLQKAAHDLDVIHWLAGGYTRRVQAFGDLMVYGQIADRRGPGEALMPDWWTLDHWPPLAQTRLNPVVDVEDVSLVNLVLDNGVLAAYQQCHFTPDYWRNYTVIGTEGRLENCGDGPGGVIRLWNRRHQGWDLEGDAVFPIADPGGSHAGADPRLIAEFLDFVRGRALPTTSPVGAREAVATGCAATDSLRAGGELRLVPEPDPAAVAYFAQRTRP